MTTACAVASHDDLDSLVALDRKALTERWVAVFGYPAPRHCQVTMLRGALAWHSQLEHQANAGSVGIERLIQQLRRSVAGSTPTAILAPGTRLLREWQGQTHHVTVTSQGFEYSGKTYRSLTAITRHITGTAWSGPLFFGLRP
jgi:hypothetical protein